MLCLKIQTFSTASSTPPLHAHQPSAGAKADDLISGQSLGRIFNKILRIRRYRHPLRETALYFTPVLFLIGSIALLRLISTGPGPGSDQRQVIVFDTVGAWRAELIRTVSPPTVLSTTISMNGRTEYYSHKQLLY
jgi:hypothetical protein